MNRSHHPDLEDLLRISEDPQDPAHTHVASCAKCAAALAQLDTFLHDDSLPEGADVEAAERVLQATLVAELPAASSPRRSPAPRPARVFRPAWAIAAVLVLGLGVTMILQQRGQPPEIVLRGDGAPDSLALQPPQLVNGSIHLQWNHWPEAESYRVRFYSPSLVEVSTHDVDTHQLVIPRTSLLASGEERLLYRVFAVVAGDEIQASRVGTLSLLDQ